jgi:putative oxidoreductase
MNTSSSSPVHRGYALLIAAASWLQSPLLLLIRLYWGGQFCVGGWAKLHNHDKITEYFASLHIPMPGVNAWLAGATECFGGALLLIGLASRLTTLPLIFTMIIAYATADSDGLQSLEKFTEATPFLFLLACLIVLAFGPGALSVDYLLGRQFGTARGLPRESGGR